MLPCLSLLCFAVFGPPGLALGGLGPAPAPSAVSVRTFGASHDRCRAWSDGCVICRAAVGGGPAQCSTPGIACTPRPVACDEP